MASKFTILQLGKEEIKYEFYIGRIELYVSASGGTYSFGKGTGTGTLGGFKILSLKNDADINYTVSTDVNPFIEINNDTQLITVKPNDTDTERTGIVEFIQNESEDTIQLIIYQKGVETQPKPYFIVVGSGGLISKVEI